MALGKRGAALACAVVRPEDRASFGWTAVEQTLPSSHATPAKPRTAVECLFGSLHHAQYFNYHDQCGSNRIVWLLAHYDVAQQFR